MIRIVNVTGVETLEDYRLRIQFSDGTSGVHDFSPVVKASGPMVEPLRDQKKFQKVFVSMGVLSWPNGFDLDSVALHREMAAAGELEGTASRLDRQHQSAPIAPRTSSKASSRTLTDAKTAAAAALTQSKKAGQSAGKQASKVLRGADDSSPNLPRRKKNA